MTLTTHQAIVHLEAIGVLVLLTLFACRQWHRHARLVRELKAKEALLVGELAGVKRVTDELKVRLQVAQEENQRLRLIMGSRRNVHH